MKTKVVKKKASKSTPMKDYEVQVERTSIVLSVYTTTVKARAPHYARKVALTEVETHFDTIEWTDTGNETDTFNVIAVAPCTPYDLQSKEDVEIYKHLTRNDLLDAIVDKIMIEKSLGKWDGKFTSHIIRHGYKGYANCTDAELIEAYKSLCEE